MELHGVSQRENLPLIIYKENICSFNRRVFPFGQDKQEGLSIRYLKAEWNINTELIFRSIGRLQREKVEWISLLAIKASWLLFALVKEKHGMLISKLLKAHDTNHKIKPNSFNRQAFKPSPKFFGNYLTEEGDDEKLLTLPSRWLSRKFSSREFSSLSAHIRQVVSWLKLTPKFRELY